MLNALVEWRKNSWKYNLFVSILGLNRHYGGVVLVMLLNRSLES